MHMYWSIGVAVLALSLELISATPVGLSPLRQREEPECAKIED